MRNLLIAISRNPWSLAGAAVTTASAVLIVSLFSLELFGLHGGPYIGILAFLILPAFFVLGLLLIPLGMAQERRRRARAAAQGVERPDFPVLDLNRPRTRSIAIAFVLLTLVNVVILATATYKGVETMESTEFCGQACHSVMQPEFTAYQRSPHARVACVQCHIGPGAPWFVRSKLSGAWQVVSVNFDLYPRPVPSPIANLRPARETCEQCHLPTIFVGDRLQVATRYAEDEANTELKTVLLLRVGGVEGRRSHGIHWHVDPGVRIRYRSDATRETIGDVELTRPDGTVTVFRKPGVEESVLAPGWRTMDCVDCHNRPSHTFYPPELEVNQAITEGRIDRSLPFLRREGVAALKQEYPSHEAAARGIAAQIATFYRSTYPQVAAAKGRQIAQAGQVLGELWASNVFPAMNITWGTYPNHIGHEATPGCFRCHDEEHATDSGQTISQDCSTCHSLLAMEEENPQILTDLQP